MFKRLNLVSFVAKRLIQRRPAAPKERVTPQDLLWKTIENYKINTREDWKEVRNEILSTVRSINSSNIDAITVNMCTVKKQFGLAQSYLDFLKTENIEINLATLGKYFRLLYCQGLEQFSKEDEDRILLL